MTTLKDRERAFEAKFGHDTQMQFNAMSRRNRLLGLWAAQVLGKSDHDAELYANHIVSMDIHPHMPNAVEQALIDDLADYAEPREIRAQMEKLLQTAKSELLAESYDR